MFVNYRKKYSALITRLNVENYSQGYDIPRVVFCIAYTDFYQY